MKDTGHNSKWEPVMSFTEIGAQLGITKQAARNAYQSGMKKLRTRKKRFLKQHDLAKDLGRLRDERQPALPDWGRIGGVWQGG